MGFLSHWGIQWILEDCYRILSGFYGHNYNIDICFFTLKDSLGVLQKYQRTVIDILCVCIRLKVTIVALIEILLHLGLSMCFATYIIKHFVPFCESIEL